MWLNHGIDPALPKRPYWLDAKGKWHPEDWNDAGNQVSLYEAVDRHRLAGLYARDHIHVIDFDGVIDPDTGVLTEPLVNEVLQKLNTYSSYSRSGTGLHVFLRSNSSRLPIPSRNLSFRENAGKTGQWMGGDKPGYIAVTGVPVPAYAKRPVVEMTDEQWEWLCVKLWKRTPSSNSSPSKVSSRNPAHAPTTASRAQEPRSELFGVKWESKSLNYIRRVCGWNWKTIKGMTQGNVKDHSLWNQYVLRAYFLHVKEWNNRDALRLSREFESYFDNHAPEGIWYERSKKSELWHRGQVLEANQHAEDTRRKHGRRSQRTPSQDLEKDLLRWLGRRWVSHTARGMLNHLVYLADGQDRYTIGDEELGMMLGLSKSTINRCRRDELPGYDVVEVQKTKPVTYVFHFD